MELTAGSLWSEVSSRLRGALNETTYRTWFGEVDGVELTDDELVLGVPNDFTREWIEGHFLGLIGAGARDVTGLERRVRLRVSERLEAPAATSAPQAEPALAGVEPPERRHRLEPGGMNPKYTFDSFVIGSSNRFAHAAALAVAEAPAQA